MKEIPLYVIGEVEAPQVLLTVPHGGCKGDGRDCDLKAATFCQYLKTALESHGIHVQTAINSTMSRQALDMNRKEARNTRYRKQISRILGTFTPSSILLDIHSSPRSTLKGRPFDIYLLDMSFSMQDNDFNADLFVFLSSRGVLIEMLRGSDENDIIYEAIEYFGAKNLSLLEINEALENEKIEAIGEQIALFIADRIIL